MQEHQEVPHCQPSLKIQQVLRLPFLALEALVEHRPFQALEALVAELERPCPVVPEVHPLGVHPFLALVALQAYPVVQVVHP